MAVVAGALTVAGPHARISTPSTPSTRTAAPAAQEAKPATPASEGAGAVVVVDTAKGTFEFETYPKEAPKTVEHILSLVKKNFYNGQVFHRVVNNFVVQWGDPQTRDMRLKNSWGNGGSGKPIGVGEMSPLRTHKYGAVAMAYAGSPARADSQMYVVIRPNGTPDLDGKYTVFGQVISGMDVVQKISQYDAIKRMSIRATAAPPTK
jgi:peptidyl-prolyl cis-trans isomerase B (cyclophilin B)